MKKITKTLLASYLLCSAFAVGGVAVATAENGTRAAKNWGYAPDITVEWGEYSKENIPQAVKNTPYQIFTATAEDVYGDEVAVKTRVYLHYLEDTKNLITMKNNEVIPMHYGIYTVEYTATDALGNVAVSTYEFSCEEGETLSLSLSETHGTAVAGEQTEIAEYTYANEMGLVTTSITATHEDGKIVYDLTGKESFMPMYAGEYTVEYVCSDFNLTVKESYILTVENRDMPIFVGKANLPKYFIVGKEYTLPTVEAYQFATGNPVLLSPTILLKQGRERERKLDGYTFTPEKEGEMSVIYKIACGENVQTQVYTVQVIDVGEVGTTFDVAKYFYADKAFVEATSDNVSVTTETEGASVEFINALPARNFSVEFSATVDKAKFDALNIYLRDSEDESIRLKLTYGNPGSASGYFCVNDGDRYSTKAFTSVVQTISFDAAAKTASFGGSISVPIPENFEGFSSGKVYCSLEFSGVKDHSEVELYAIDNHVLLESGGDDFAPLVWFTIDSQSVHQINDLVTLQGIEVGDVFDDTVHVKYSVAAPNDKYVIDENGVCLDGDVDYTKDYTFRVTQFGEYRVKIRAEDSTGNSQNYGFIITVADVVEPVVKLNNKLPKQLEAGETFVVGDITIFDDLSKTFETTVILMEERGFAKEVKIGEQYKLSSAGVYRLYYMVTDESGNTAILCHTITVI